MSERAIQDVVHALFTIATADGVSDNALAVRSGFTQTAVQSWRRGTSSPTAFSLACTLEALGYRLVVTPIAGKAPTAGREALQGHACAIGAGVSLDEAALDRDAMARARVRAALNATEREVFKNLQSAYPGGLHKPELLARLDKRLTRGTGRGVTNIKSVTSCVNRMRQKLEPHGWTITRMAARTEGYAIPYALRRV